MRLSTRPRSSLVNQTTSLFSLSLSIPTSSSVTDLIVNFFSPVKIRGFEDTSIDRN